MSALNLSEFAFQLLLLFVPGIICSYIIDTFTNHKERTQFQFLLSSFVYGLMAYGLLWVTLNIIDCFYEVSYASTNFLGFLQGGNQAISFAEIFYACIFAVLLASMITYVHTHKLHFKLFRALNITTKFGELDVWGYLMNSDEVSWITVRDLENNLMYDGWVQAFSDNSKEAEVLLGDVFVYENATGDFLYEVASQYLSLDRNKISIEVRKIEASKDVGKKDTN